MEWSSPLAWVFTLLLFTQAIGLIVVSLSVSRIRTDYRSKWFHPIGWLTIFYLGWFGIPQIYFLASDGFLVGFEQYDVATRLQYAVRSQLYLIAFLVTALGVSLTLQQIFSRLFPDTKPLDYDSVTRPLTKAFAWLCFIVGVAAVLKLGQQNLASDEMRSALVKTTGGKILTILMYYGVFGFAFLMGESLRCRQYFLAAVLTVAFAGPVFLTGARGRFVLPLIAAVVYFSTSRRKLFTSVHYVALAISICVIAFADRLLNSFKYDQDADLGRGWAEMFERRNFDGFSNFALICNTYQQDFQPSVLWQGARDVFMNYFFPSFYARGVGFGSTVPGTGWIAGGAVGLILVAIGYGMVLGCADIILRSSKSAHVFWAYLLAITWIGSLAGNYVESADKFIIATSPPLIILAIQFAWDRFISLRSKSSYDIRLGHQR